VSEKRIDTILKVSNLDELELDKDGKFKESDKLTESIKEEWADFIVQEQTQGANTPTPPNNANSHSTSAYKSKSEIMAIKDGAERRKAIAENPELFGLKFKE
jgi:hypothetical protein